MSPKPSFKVRAVPSVEAFVAGEDDASASRTSPANVQTSERPGARAALVDRRDGRQLRRRTVYLPADLDRRLRAHCAEHDVDASEVLARALGATLQGQG